jgi:hypothetical protein
MKSEKFVQQQQDARTSPVHRYVQLGRQCVAPREWAVHNRIPLLQPTLFSGEGAAGKTLVELQLAAAHVNYAPKVIAEHPDGKAFF